MVFDRETMGLGTRSGRMAFSLFRFKEQFICTLPSNKGEGSIGYGVRSGLAEMGGFVSFYVSQLSKWLSNTRGALEYVRFPVDFSHLVGRWELGPTGDFSSDSYQSSLNAVMLERVRRELQRSV